MNATASIPAKEGMGSADAAWLHMDKPVNPMVISALIELEGELSQPRLEEVILTRLVAVYPKFAMKISEHFMPLRGPSWERDQAFHLSRHVHRLSPRPPQDGEALRELVSDLVSQPLPHDRPLWQMHLIDVEGQPASVERRTAGVERQTVILEKQTVLLVKMHHCIADGIALARVLLSLTDEAARPRARVGSRATARPQMTVEPNADAGIRVAARSQTVADSAARGAFQPPLHPHANALLSAAEGAAHQGLESALHPMRLLQLAQSGVKDAQTLARLMLLPADPKGEGQLKGQLSGDRRVGWCEPLRLQAVKEIAHSHHATVNDVMLSAVSGAFRTHMLRQRGRASGQGPSADRLPVDGGPPPPKPMRMRAIVPFNLRPLSEPLPRSLGNRFGLVFLDLPVEVGDRRRRLALVKERMDAIKASPEGPVSYGVLQAIGLTPEQVEGRFVDLFSSKGTAVVTNVPGPQAPRWLAGSKVASIQIWAPTSGSVGLSVSVISYDGMVAVGLMADDMLLHDPQGVAERVRVEVDALARLRPSKAAAA